MSQGLMYLTPKDQPHFDLAKPGAVLRIDGRAPPWLIVNHSLAKTLMPDWPGRLVTAEVLDPITDQEQRQYSGPISPHAGYTRAAAVRIVDELNVADLFGRNGQNVSRIIDFASTIDESCATALVRSRDRGADEIQNRVRERIAVEVECNGSGLASPFEHGSPVGALYFLDQVVTKRALAVVGDSALETYPDDPEGGWLTEPWVSACSCLYDIALVAGAPETITSAERASLMRSWERP